MIRDEDKKLGGFLLQGGILSPAQLVEVLKLKRHSPHDLPQIIINKDYASPKEVYQCLADYLNLPFIELEDYDIDSSVLGIIPPELVHKHKVLPVFKIEDTLTVAMTNPGDVHIIDTLRRETGCEIEPAVSVEEDLRQALEKYFGSAENLDSSFDEVIQDIEIDKPKEEQVTSAEKLKQLSAETPVVKLVNLIISQAIQDKASDIHIEPEEKSVQVRFRIDGILHESSSPPKALQAAIISRIKILADLDIAESRIPQDGRYQVSLNGREIDLRVSTLPTVYGENVVLRILDKGSLALDLGKLGFEPDALRQFNEILASSYGVILVSGPTGSGKTTTLYSALQSINTPEKNIITVEDPVEYRLKRIRQAQVNVKAGLTFAAGLRSILRQDPDIIMIGEIRDQETAKTAVESALTGHLVLSTIHTNDAPGGLTRLTEMGVEPFLTASATVGILAQRLVRRLCDNCKQAYTPKPAMLKKLKLGRETTQKQMRFYHGAGCKLCKNTGYKGRQGIYELMKLNEEIRELTLKNASSDQIKRAAYDNGMRSLRHDGVIKALKGVTSLEEVFRVTNLD
ncbi:Flp pilus assembly complex ATPase component TadA [bacterium]|nr:Flp pilus assembly complex ATPase component TadA [bacterium]